MVKIQSSVCQDLIRKTKHKKPTFLLSCQVFLSIYCCFSLPQLLASANIIKSEAPTLQKSRKVLYMMSESSPPISGICCIREFSQQDHGGTLHGHLQLEGFGLKGEYRGLLLVLHITFTLSCSPHHEVQGLS